MRTFDPLRRSPPRPNPLPNVDLREASWRVQVVEGELYVTVLSLYHHMSAYGASAVLAVLNALKRRRLPDVDLLLNNYDETVVAGRRHYQDRGAGQGGPRLPPLVLSPARSKKSQDVPFVDYSFYYPLRPHPLRTRRWDAERAAILEAARAMPWEARAPVAAWSGNVDKWNPRFADRRALADLAGREPEHLFVNDVNVAVQPGEVGALRPCVRPELRGAERAAALGAMRGLSRGCDLPFADLCAFRCASRRTVCVGWWWSRVAGVAVLRCDVCGYLVLSPPGKRRLLLCVAAAIPAPAQVPRPRGRERSRMHAWLYRCACRYLVHVGGNTYSNRLKQLLLCGSAVVYVANRGDHREFYEAALVPGVHLVHVPTVADVPGVTAM